MMKQRIPEQRSGAETSSEVTTPCAVEDCGERGTQRFFPGYVLTLCTRHWIKTADGLRSEGAYW